MEKQTKAQIISGAICGILIMLCTIIYLIIGICTNIWHPTWIVIPCSGIVCGIVSISINTYANLHTEEASKTEDKSGDKKDKSTSK